MLIIICCTKLHLNDIGINDGYFYNNKHLYNVNL